MVEVAKYLKLAPRNQATILTFSCEEGAIINHFYLNKNVQIAVFGLIIK